LALAVSACASDGNSQTAPAPDTSFADPKQPAVDSWINAELPEPFSLLAGTGGVIAYQAVVDNNLVVIGVDGASGGELYRLDTHPLSELRAVTPALVVIEDEGVVVRAVLNGNRASLSATEIATGLQVWSTPIPLSSGQPFACGEAVCVRSPDGHFSFDPKSGDQLEDGDFGGSTVLGVALDGTVITSSDRTNPTGNFDRLIAIESPDSSPRWEIERSKFEDASSVAVNPSSGWGTTIDEELGVVALYLGAETDPSAFGVLSGVDLSTGELLWTDIDNSRCQFSDHLQPALVVCGVDDNGATSTVERLDFRTGLPIWTISTDPEEVFWIDVIGSNIQIVTDSSSTMVSLDSGKLVDTPATLCVRDSTFVDIDYGGGELVGYRSAQQPTVCSPNGGPMTAEQILATDIDAGPALVDVGGDRLVTVNSAGVLSGTRSGE